MKTSWKSIKHLQKQMHNILPVTLTRGYKGNSLKFLLTFDAS